MIIISPNVGLICGNRVSENKKLQVLFCFQIQHYRVVSFVDTNGNMNKNSLVCFDDIKRGSLFDLRQSYIRPSYI